MDSTTLFNTILALVFIAGFLISAMIMSGILSDKETRTAWMSEVEDKKNDINYKILNDPMYSDFDINIYHEDGLKADGD